MTFPVVELAALVLARTGDRQEAAALVRQAFEFDPTAAADLLLKLESDLGETVTGQALAEDPRAWVAWGRALFDAGRPEESQAVLVEAAAQWRDDLELLVILSRRAASSADWDALDRWTNHVDPIPVEGHGVELLAYRALLHAERMEPARAEADLGSVLSVAGMAPHVLVIVGDVQDRLGSIETARKSWNRALFRIPPERSFERIEVLVRLAKLEESDGRASVALRHWRAVIELDPTHAAARARIRALTGGS